ncbi:MAG: hypothetical protein LQ346_006277 [Caloplaca aetnensis]|nr:MAG: hypothetical protein LQ346_006277 [Caloplaca aetnensis]
MLASSSTLFLLLATFISSAISHPLNLLHTHHHHRAHRHVHLRLPFLSDPAKSALQVQQPISGTASPALDITNVFVNMTTRESESSAPSSFMIPLRASSPQVELTAAIFHHPRTARISNIQYGTSTKDQSRPFERAEEVTCYAHTQSTGPEAHGRNSQRTEPQTTKLEPFRQSDGEINFADAGGKWFAAEGQVTGFDCLLKS